MTRPAIFITGAAAGIGRATAELFAARGWFVGLYDRDGTAVEALAHSLPADSCIGGTLDVVDAGGFAAALQAFVTASGGRLDLLFNCAGILSVGDFESIPVERHQAIADVNFKGVLNGCHAALPHLLRTSGAQVINMASASAFYGVPGFASYSATKFAVRGLTEALNIEWRRHGIRVMDVMPLFVRTPMVDAIDAGSGSVRRLGVRLTAQTIAATVWRAAHAPRWWPKVHWLPGWQTRLVYLGIRLSPVWLNRWSGRVLSDY